MHVRPSPDRRLAEPRWYHWLGAYAIMAGLWMVGILLLPVTLVVLAVMAMRPPIVWLSARRLWSRGS
jgi:predicted PurR-regulated permease PerM